MFRDEPDNFEEVKCWILKGAYQADNREQLQQCRQCDYYLMMQEKEGIVSDFDTGLAIITCSGVINNDKTRALEKIWTELKQNKKTHVLLDVREVNNIYSCGLGIIVRMHKETAEGGGILVVVGAHGYLLSMIESIRLNRVLHLEMDIRAAKERIDRLKEKKAEEKEAKKKKKPKERPPCWVYWNNHNPKNANTCDECFRKINPTEQPCWIIEGVIEGVSFQYVNEDCESCPYFVEFSE
jgi:anti-sigma B factor antagonist